MLGWTPGSEEAGLSRQTLSGIRTLVSKLRRVDTLEWLARVNIALTEGGTYEEGFQERLAELLYKPDWIQAMRRLSPPEAGPITFFHPGMVRSLIKIAWQSANLEVGYHPLDQNVRFELGHALLSIWDHISSAPLAEDGSIDSFLHVAVATTTQVYKSNRDIQHVLPTKDYVVSRLLETSDIDKQVKEALGLSISEIIQATLVNFVFFSRGKPEYFDIFGRLYSDPRYLFGKVSLPRRVGKWFEHNFVGSLHEPPQIKDESPRSELIDISCLIERPFLKLSEGEWICLDFDSVKNLLSRGVFKIINDVTERKSLHEKIGDPFELYLNRLLERSKERSRLKGVVVLPPRKREPDLDGAYQAGHTTLLFECKTGVVPWKDLARNDIEMIKRKLVERYIIGRKSPKGFKQLANRVRTFVQTPESFGLRRTAFVIPVIVADDSFIANTFANTWLRNQARSLFTEFGCIVPGIITLHISDVALLALRSDQFDLAESVFELATRGFRGTMTVSHWLDDAIDFFPGDIERKDEEVLTGCLGTAFNEVIEKFQQGFEKKCEVCSSAMSLAQLSKNPLWVCTRDQTHPRPLASGMESLEFWAERERVIHWYEKSDDGSM